MNTSDTESGGGSCCHPPPKPAAGGCCHGGGDAGSHAAVHSTAPYFCPMCPGVESETAATCPKCGMALEQNLALGASDEDAREELRRLTVHFWFSAAASLPVFTLAMAHMIPGMTHLEWTDGLPSRTAQMFLTCLVAGGPGRFVFERAWASIKERSANMFTLIALGVGAALGFSLAAMLFPDWFPDSLRDGHGRLPVYFEAAAVILTLVLLGQVLEAGARLKTGDAIRSLFSLRPATARMVTDDGDVDVMMDAVEPGLRLRIRPGERVPADGLVLEGESHVDESLFTGEPHPVKKQAGARLTGGTLNQNGSLVMRVESAGMDSALGRMIRLVAEAQRSRAPVQALVDRVAAWFVPVVVAVAVLTFALWLWLGPEPALARALTSAVAVLIIACPCALGLATPVSVTVGIGRGAQLGILIRDAAAIEKLASMRVLAVDKTGTLTTGKPSVTDILTSAGGDLSEYELLRLAAAVERHSEHPLATAVTRAHEERQGAASCCGGGHGDEQSAPQAETREWPPAEDFSAIPGAGVRARVGAAEVLVGKADWLESLGVTGLEELKTASAPAQSKGKTAVFLAVNGRARGALLVGDPVKPGTPEALAALRVLGVEVVMLTGDHERTAASVAEQLGISRVHAGLSPEGKHKTLTQLRQTGVTGMAGDGINDAPALAAADVGIAMGSGADIAMESAAVTLAGGDLCGISQAVGLGRAMMGNIRQNLAFAFLYNALGIPVAAGLLYPWFGILLSPMLAGVAMSLSSVSVIANALRLRRWGAPQPGLAVTRT